LILLQHVQLQRLQGTETGKGYASGGIGLFRYVIFKRADLLLTLTSFLSGMASNTRDSRHNPVTRADANRNRRKTVQVQFEDEYQAALVNTKEK
jgi:hypothetical protein